MEQLRQRRTDADLEAALAERIGELKAVRE